MEDGEVGEEEDGVVDGVEEVGEEDGEEVGGDTSDPTYSLLIQ